MSNGTLGLGPCAWPTVISFRIESPEIQLEKMYKRNSREEWENLILAVLILSEVKSQVLFTSGKMGK